jgi:hypothetical protein
MKSILEKILNISNKELDSLDISFFKYILLLPYAKFFESESGLEHYRLLIYISTLLDNSTIYDIGTHRCYSSIALSFNKTNKVISYDVIKQIPSYPIKSNIKYCLGNIIDKEDLNNSSLIFLDVNHDGIFENKFYNHLHDINWKGLLILDDINLNDDMKLFWNNIIEEKYDITKIGHWSGTGIVYFK